MTEKDFAIAQSSEVQETSAQSSLVSWLKRHQLLAFFVLTFVITWGGWFLLLAVQSGLFPFKLTVDDLAGTIWFRLAGYGPIISAIVLTALVSGKKGLRDFFERCIRWRVGPQWYAVALFTVLVIMLATAVAYRLLSGTFPGNPYLATWYTPILWFFPGVLIAIGLAAIPEEPGWRGYALPRLLSRYNPLPASLILGFIWGLWHLPIYPLDGDSIVIFFLLLLQAPALSILMTWVYLHTKRSTLISIIFHGATDSPWVIILSGVNDIKVNVILIVALWTAVAIIVAIFGPHLTRMPLAERADELFK